MSYSATIEDGREIYIPDWPVNVQLENLTTACKYLGDGNVISISKLSVPAAKFAVMNAEDPRMVSKMVRNFVCQVRLDGSKITDDTFDGMFEGKLSIVIELFTHLVHSQYDSFFD